jgi:hypothetical protein
VKALFTLFYAAHLPFYGFFHSSFFFFRTWEMSQTFFFTVGSVSQ